MLCHTLHTAPKINFLQVFPQIPFLEKKKKKGRKKGKKRRKKQNAKRKGGKKKKQEKTHGSKL